MFIASLGICDEPPTAQELLHLAIQCALFDKDEDRYADVIKHLVNAWAALREQELNEQGKEFKPKWVRYDSAETVYRKAYCTVRPREDDCWWPDALPYDSDLPAGFVKLIAQALARKDLAMEKYFFEYMKRTENEKTT